MNKIFSFSIELETAQHRCTEKHSFDWYKIVSSFFFVEVEIRLVMHILSHSNSLHNLDCCNIWAGSEYEECGSLISSIPSPPVFSEPGTSTSAGQQQQQQQQQRWQKQWLCWSNVQILTGVQSKLTYFCAKSVSIHKDNGHKISRYFVLEIFSMCHNNVVEEK